MPGKTSREHDDEGRTSTVSGGGSAETPGSGPVRAAAGGRGEASGLRAIWAKAASASSAWHLMVAVGLASSVGYYLPSLPVPVRESIYLGTDMVAVGALFAALGFARPARPLAWAMIGAGMALLALGDVAWDWLVFVENSAPSPSIADAFYLAEYPFLLIGVMLLARGRPDRTTVLDTLIVTIASGALLWEALVQPQLQDGSPSLELVVNVAYPIADIALIGVVASVVLSSGLGSSSFRLIAAGLLLTLIADLTYLEANVAGIELDPFPTDFVYPLSMCLWAAAALHPSARGQAATARSDWLGKRPYRLAAVGGACLLVPGSIALDAIAGNLADLPWILVAWAVLVILLVARIDEVLHQAQASERRFRAIFEGSPAGIGIARGDVILEANPAVRAMFGHESEPAITETSVSAHVAAAARAAFQDRQRARSEGRPRSNAFETIGLRADGTEFPLEVRASAIELAEGPATIGFFRDLTSEREAREALRSSARMYRELFDGNPHPMWIYDLETLRFLAVNETAVARYGWSREEFLAMTIRDIRPAEDVPALLANIRDATDQLQVSGPWRHLHKDGSLVDVEISSHDLAWEGRHARLVLALDVTERTRLEEQLRQAQKMEAVGRLAGGVAHDFNNMLTAITGYANLVKSSLDPADPRLADLGEILLASERAGSLTRQLLAFSRRQILQPQVIDPNEAILGLAGMLRRLIGEDVELKTVLAADLAPIRVDPSQLVQVLMNLAVNARDAMPSGGTLTVETANLVARQHLPQADGPGRVGPHVLIAVSDTGKGMDAETQRHLFEPFFTTKPMGLGTGLGLATVYGIVKQSGGTVRIYSEPGHGTTVKIRLPAVEAETTETDELETPATVLMAPATILVVEDEPAVRRLVATLLRRYGHQVLEAGDPDEGETVAAACAGALDLLVTDVVMPGRSGAELADQLTAARPELKVLYMSGYTENAIVHQGALDDGVAFVSKPFEPNAFLAKVQELLRTPRNP
jgi:two-component system cell cycle sensor histidine kinase/response regulator CckA